MERRAEFGKVRDDLAEIRCSVEQLDDNFQLFKKNIFERLDAIEKTLESIMRHTLNIEAALLQTGQDVKDATREMRTRRGKE